MDTWKSKALAKISIFFPISIAAVILCYSGLSNHFPLLFPDTGTYLNTGFGNQLPSDRPVVYGIFIRHVSLYESLWLVIFVQSLIVSALLYIFLSIFLRPYRLLPAFFTFVICITIFTGASVHVSQLIPDIFAPICILVICILIVKDEISIALYFFLFVVGVISIGSHNSHLFIAAGILLVYSILYFIKRKGVDVKGIFIKKMKCLMPVVITGMFFNNIICLVLGHGFSPPNGSHVFILNRLVQTGLLEKYLNENCDKNVYKLCNYRNEIPGDFIWDFANSPLYKTGGWEENREEYNKIIWNILTTPEYLKKFIVRSIEAGFQQMFSFDTGDTPVQRENSSPYASIKAYFPELMRDYHDSHQYNGHLSYDLLNNIQKYFIGISLLFIILFLFNGGNLQLKHITLLIVCGIIINAFVCGALSGVNARYQSRIIWLLPLPLFISLFNSGSLSKFYFRIIHE